MPIPIDENCIVPICDVTTHIKYELLHQTAQYSDERKDKIDEFIEEIQTSMCKSINNNKTKSQIKKHKHMEYRYIPHAIRDYHKYEEKVRQLEHAKVNLGKDISTARRKNDTRALEKFNKELYYVRIDIEDAVYMRERILDDIRKTPGYDKFANIKCKFFSNAIGCHNGLLCPYRH